MRRTSEPVEMLSVGEALAQLREAERRRDEATTRMDALLAELGYKPVRRPWKQVQVPHGWKQVRLGDVAVINPKRQIKPEMNGC